MTLETPVWIRRIAAITVIAGAPADGYLGWQLRAMLSSMTRRRTPNPKRRIAEPTPDAAEREARGILAAKVTYVGSPLHKRNPGDFGLTPPSSPRLGKTLCDGCGVLRKAIAQQMLAEGVERGLISEQHRSGWPQNIWAVSPEGHVLEAQLDNQDIGTYHGYPLSPDDPLRETVLARWGSQ